MNSGFSLKQIPEIISAASSNVYGILALSVITIGFLAYILFCKVKPKTKPLVFGFASICIIILGYLAIHSQNTVDKVSNDKSKQEIIIKSTGVESPAIGNMNGSITYDNSAIIDKRKE